LNKSSGVLLFFFPSNLQPHKNFSYGVAIHENWMNGGNSFELRFFFWLLAFGFFGGIDCMLEAVICRQEKKEEFSSGVGIMFFRKEKSSYFFRKPRRIYWGFNLKL
jgi:hypothetical protein